MNEPRRLHPLSIAFTFFKLLRSAIIPLIVFLSGTFNEIGGISPWIWWLVGVAFILIFVLPSFLTWYRFTYRVDDGELKIQYGAFVKNHRYIRRERIQSVHRSSGILHRPFGLVKVQIETLGGRLKKPEAEFSAISLADAEQLEAALYGKKERLESEKEEPAERDEPAEVSRKVLPHHLLIAGATSGKIGVVLSAVAAIFSQIDNLFPKHFYAALYHRLLTTGIHFLVILLISAAIVAWILSILGTVLRYSDFTLTRTGNELKITSGFLERRNLTLPVHRIQAVRIVEGLLRQPFGFASLYVESAGGSSGRHEEVSTVLFPILPKSEITAFLNEFVPDYPVAYQLSSAPKRALFRYLLWQVVPALIISIPVAVWVPWGSYALLLVPLALFFGTLRYRDAGWALLHRFTVFRYRVLARTTVIVPKKNIQASEVRQSYFQKRSKLATLGISVISRSAGRSFQVAHLEAAAGDQLLNWYRRKR
ncbi:MAG TPA: PH domain-containing protein [Bacillales bacterium]|nr:PH domain-containing protein [Bacillales bacterium]